MLMQDGNFESLNKKERRDDWEHIRRDDGPDVRSQRCSPTGSLSESSLLEEVRGRINCG